MAGEKNSHNVKQGTWLSDKTETVIRFAGLQEIMKLVKLYCMIRGRTNDFRKTYM